MIETIFYVWVLILGIHALTREQMPFEFLQKFTHDKNLELRSVLFEPVIECRTCMASLWTCIYFGYYYQLDWLLLSIYCWFFAWLIIMSILFGRAIDVDFFSKILYFVLVASFIFLLPSHNMETVFCMVAVVGLNYHLGKIID